MWIKDHTSPNVYCREGTGYNAQGMGLAYHLIVNDWMIIALKYAMNSELCIYKFQHMLYEKYSINLSWYTLHQTMLVPEPVSLDSSPERDLEIPPCCSGMSGTEDR